MQQGETKLNLHNQYGYGQLFCFSGLEGETSRTHDFVGMLMDEPIRERIFRGDGRGVFASD